MAKVRVHELAKKYDVPSKDVLTMLGELGEFVKAPSSTVEPPVVKRFEDKYGADSADLAIPADLPEIVAEECRRLAVAAAGAIRAEGMARVDFFLEEDGRGLLVNEVNNIPGFTPVSMFPRLWAAAGVPYDALVDRLVALALERHARRAGRVVRRRQLGTS